jgi:hypothetical protein
MIAGNHLGLGGPQPDLAHPPAGQSLSDGEREACSLCKATTLPLHEGGDLIRPAPGGNGRDQRDQCVGGNRRHQVVIH